MAGASARVDGAPSNSAASAQRQKTREREGVDRVIAVAVEYPAARMRRKVAKPAHYGTVAAAASNAGPARPAPGKA
jgi:hypothetical protein